MTSTSRGSTESVEVNGTRGVTVAGTGGPTAGKTESHRPRGTIRLVCA